MTRNLILIKKEYLTNQKINIKNLELDVDQDEIWGFCINYNEIRFKNSQEILFIKPAEYKACVENGTFNVRFPKENEENCRVCSAKLEKESHDYEGFCFDCWDKISNVYYSYTPDISYCNKLHCKHIPIMIKRYKTHTEQELKPCILKNKIMDVMIPYNINIKIQANINKGSKLFKGNPDFNNPVVNSLILDESLPPQQQIFHLFHLLTEAWLFYNNKEFGNAYNDKFFIYAVATCLNNYYDFHENTDRYVFYKVNKYYSHRHLLTYKNYEINDVVCNIIYDLDMF